MLRMFDTLRGFVMCFLPMFDLCEVVVGRLGIAIPTKVRPFSKVNNENVAEISDLERGHTLVANVIPT